MAGIPAVQVAAIIAKLKAEIDASVEKAIQSIKDLTNDKG